MSDPLSAAGSAVGITSLGIQVCQGLVWYLQSLDGRSQAIKETLEEIRTLISVFYSLNDILPKIDKRRCAETTAIRQCLRACVEKIGDLQQLLPKLGGPSSTASARDKMKSAGKALVYPFREEKLTSLRRSLQELLDCLQLTINVSSLSGSLSFYLCDHITDKYISSGTPTSFNT